MTTRGEEAALDMSDDPGARVAVPVAVRPGAGRRLLKGEDADDGVKCEADDDEAIDDDDNEDDDSDDEEDDEVAGAVLDWGVTAC